MIDTSYVSAYGRRTAPSARITFKKNNPMATQSEEGKGLGSWTSISLSQQTGLPSPALVHRISVPHTEQRYLFPSWLIDYYLQYSNSLRIFDYNDEETITQIWNTLNIERICAILFEKSAWSRESSFSTLSTSLIPSAGRSNGLSHYRLLLQ